MVAKKRFFLFLFIFLVFVVGCSVAGEGEMATPQSAGLALSVTVTVIPSATAADLATVNYPGFTQQSKTPTQAVSPTSTNTLAPTETEVVFEAGKEINIKYLRDLEIIGNESTFEEELVDRSNYHSTLLVISRKVTKSMVC